MRIMYFYLDNLLPLIYDHHEQLNEGDFLSRYPFESPEAAELNRQIFETIYFSALEASCEIAQKDGKYETYEGSPVSQGVSGLSCLLGGGGGGLSG